MEPKKAYAVVNEGTCLVVRMSEPTAEVLAESYFPGTVAELVYVVPSEIWEDIKNGLYDMFEGHTADLSGSDGTEALYGAWCAIRSHGNG